jgi:hypothetical protein
MIKNGITKYFSSTVLDFILFFTTKLQMGLFDWLSEKIPLKSEFLSSYISDILYIIKGQSVISPKKIKASRSSVRKILKFHDCDDIHDGTKEHNAASDLRLVWPRHVALFLWSLYPTVGE